MSSFKSGIVASAAFACITTSAHADDLIYIDLSVPGEIWITALPGLSAATVSGTDSVGFLLADFFNAPGLGNINGHAPGDLTSAANTSSGAPALWNFAGSHGLNIWSYTTDATSDFVEGEVAFTGSAAWGFDIDDYNELLNNGGSGDIYFAADSDDDIAGATWLGTWTTIPAPSSLALLGLGGFAATRRRR